MKRAAVLLLTTLLATGSAAGLVRRERAGTGTLSLNVVDARSGAPLPARVVVRGADGKPSKGEYDHLPGVFTADDGSLRLPLAAGRYTLEVYHGIDFVSHRQSLKVEPGSVARVRVPLAPWVRLRELGFVNGDGHAHLYSDTPRNEAMLATVRRICRAQGVDFLFACQTRAGYGDADWRPAFAGVSDARFRLFHGAELPKYRTGHTFWFGLESTHGVFQGAMDETHENRFYLAGEDTRWTFEGLPFPNVPDVELVTRLREAEDAVALAAHPTSWWWQPRGGVEKYVTNVAASLPVGLLAGRVWDGLVVMGYDDDQYYYQDLWFHVLDEGYRMPPVGELDGGFPPADRFYYGRTRTYLRVGPETTRESIVRAVRAGHSFVTSGPIVLASIEAEAGGRKGPPRRYEPGDVVPADGWARLLRVQAFASGDRDARLSYVVLFRNSRLDKVWDLRGREARELEDSLPLRESGPAWYVLKAYGRTPRTPGQLDVRATVERLTQGTFEGPWPGDSEVALTSPFYFRPAGTPADPPPLLSRVRLRLVDPAGGEPVKDAAVHVELAGREIQSQPAPEGEASLRVPVHSVLRLEAPGRPTLHRTLYLDYPPQRERLERLANGRWLEGFGGRERLRPGQVPWEAFELDRTRAELADVDWIVPWKENERDPLWEAFEASFR